MLSFLGGRAEDRLEACEEAFMKALAARLSVISFFMRVATRHAFHESELINDLNLSVFAARNMAAGAHDERIELLCQYHSDVTLVVRQLMMVFDRLDREVIEIEGDAYSVRDEPDYHEFMTRLGPAEDAVRKTLAAYVSELQKQSGGGLIARLLGRGSNQPQVDYSIALLT